MATFGQVHSQSIAGRVDRSPAADLPATQPETRPIPRWAKWWLGLSAIAYGAVGFGIRGWYLELLFVGFIIVLYYSPRILPRSEKWSEWTSRLVFIFLGWVTGMALEALLPGVGDIHDKTSASFILAQGYYWTFPALALMLIERYHLTYWESFLAFGSASIIESVFVLKVVPVLAFSPLFFLAPLVFLMYFVIYGMLVSLPLAVTGTRRFWVGGRPSLARWRVYVISFLLVGAGNWIIYAVWAGLWIAATNDFAGWADHFPDP